MVIKSTTKQDGDTVRKELTIKETWKRRRGPAPKPVANRGEEKEKDMVIKDIEKTGQSQDNAEKEECPDVTEIIIGKTGKREGSPIHEEMLVLDTGEGSEISVSDTKKLKEGKKRPLTGITRRRFWARFCR